MKRVTWGMIFISEEETQFLGVESLQILVIHKIQFLKFIQTLCSLQIFLVYFCVSTQNAKYDINRYKKQFFCHFFNFKTMNFRSDND